MDGHMFDGLGMAFVLFLVIGVIAGLVLAFGGQWVWHHIPFTIQWR